MTQSNIIVLECFTLQTKLGDATVFMSGPATHTQQSNRAGIRAEIRSDSHVLPRYFL